MSVHRVTVELSDEQVAALAPWAAGPWAIDGHSEHLSMALHRLALAVRAPGDNSPPAH